MNGLVVLARHPKPGTVKTRLARSIGDDTAARVYRAFLIDIGRRLAASRAWVFHWAFTPADSPFADEIAAGARVFAQSGVDLGERMANALEHVLAEGYPHAVLIGSDVPHVPLSTIEEAFRRLAAGASLVLGPSEDGGYYLVGTRSRLPIFQGMRWGEADVLEATIAAARRAGIEPALVPPLYDVDGGEDLERLAAEIRAGRIRDLAATEATLERVSALRYR